MKTSPAEIQDNQDIKRKKSFSRTGKYRVVGSQSLRAIPYDDKYELSGGKSRGYGEALAEVLQEAYADALKHPDYSITDFHAGLDDRLFYRGDYTKNSVDEYLEEHKHLIPIRKASSVRN